MRPLLIVNLFLNPASFENPLMFVPRSVDWTSERLAGWVMGDIIFFVIRVGVADSPRFTDSSLAGSSSSSMALTPCHFPSKFWLPLFTILLETDLLLLKLRSCRSCEIEFLKGLLSSLLLSLTMTEFLKLLSV